MPIGLLDDLRIVGGHPALDLVNTVAPRPPLAVRQEFLPDTGALLRWARLVGIADDVEIRQINQAWEQTAGAAEAALVDVHDLRGMIAPALAGQQLEALTLRWRTAISRSTLAAPDRGAGGGEPPSSPGGHRADGVGSAVLLIGTDPAWMIGDRLADAVVDLVRHVDLDRLRVCPVDEGGCGWLFLDRSRNHSRRWCSMDDCGTHAKSRRLTERRRGERIAAGPAGPRDSAVPGQPRTG